MTGQESKKQQRITLKSQIDDIEGEIAEVKKRLQAQGKEANSVQKQITALDTKLEQKRADRHSLLKSCKVTQDSNWNTCLSFTSTRCTIVLLYGWYIITSYTYSEPCHLCFI